MGALICSDFIVALWSSWFANVNIIVEGEAAAEIPEGLFARSAALARERSRVELPRLLLP